MNIPSVIYIPGFMSGRASSKWQHLLKLSNARKINAACIEPDYKARAPGYILLDISKSLDQFDDPILIGHSLGGFFARAAGGELNLRTILINPSFSPDETLFGAQGDDRRLPKEFEADYLTMKATMLARKVHSPAEIVLIEHGDEIVNHKKHARLFKQSYVIERPGGSHSYEALNNIDVAIDLLKNRPWQ